MPYAIKKTDSRTQGDTVDSYHGPNGEPIAGPEGYAEVRRHWGDDGNLLSMAFFGPDGAPVAGPRGFHRAQQAPGATGPTRYFDTAGRELTSLGPETVVPVIVLSEVLDVKQPAAKAGVRVGDILWRYGNWSSPEALAAERAKGVEPDAIPGAVAQAWFSERDRLSAEPAPMTVIRGGKPVKLTVPPLPNKTIGMRLVYRAVPVAAFEEWKSTAAEERSECGTAKCGPNREEEHP